MKYRYRGKISYTMDEHHPYVKYDKEWGRIWNRKEINQVIPCIFY